VKHFLTISSSVFQNIYQNSGKNCSPSNMLVQVSAYQPGCQTRQCFSFTNTSTQTTCTGSVKILVPGTYYAVAAYRSGSCDLQSINHLNVERMDQCFKGRDSYIRKSCNASYITFEYFEDEKCRDRAGDPRYSGMVDCLASAKSWCSKR